MLFRSGVFQLTDSSGIDLGHCTHSWTQAMPLRAPWHTPNGSTARLSREFGGFRRDCQAMAKWLAELRVQLVVMESTVSQCIGFDLRRARLVGQQDAWAPALSVCLSRQNTPHPGDQTPFAAPVQTRRDTAYNCTPPGPARLTALR